MASAASFGLQMRPLPGQATAIVAPGAKNPSPTLQALPKELLNEVLRCLPGQDLAKATRTAKFFAKAAKALEASDLCITSARLEAKIKEFRMFSQNLLTESRKTWRGWLVHQLDRQSGIIGRVFQFVARFFFAYSRSFRYESIKQQKFVQWINYDFLRQGGVEAFKSNYWPYEACPDLSSRRKAYQWMTECQDFHGAMRSLLMDIQYYRDELRSDELWMSLFGGRKKFEKLPFLRINLQGGRGFFHSWKSRDVVSKMTHSIVQGFFDYQWGRLDRFFALCVENKNKLYQVRVYYRCRPRSDRGDPANVWMSVRGNPAPVSPLVWRCDSFNHNQHGYHFINSNEMTGHLLQKEIAEIRQLLAGGTADGTKLSTPPPP